MLAKHEKLPRFFWEAFVTHMLRPQNSFNFSTSFGVQMVEIWLDQTIFWCSTPISLVICSSFSRENRSSNVYLSSSLFRTFRRFCGKGWFQTSRLLFLFHQASNSELTATDDKFRTHNLNSPSPRKKTALRNDAILFGVPFFSQFRALTYLRCQKRHFLS